MPTPVRVDSMQQPIRSSDTVWSRYLERFHAERPGITECILSRCRSEGIDPYQWCASPLDGRQGPVVDVACGSGALADHLRGWIGIDLSATELAAAGARRRGPLLRAAATDLPIATGAAPSVVCSMAMQVIEPVPGAIGEIARILRPGGRAVLLLPATGPLSWRHAATYLRLQATLGRRIRYPNDHALGGRRIAALATRCGLAVASDERCGFLLPIESDAQVAELVHSLYLPGIEPRRLRRAQRMLSRQVGTELTVPLRRVVLDVQAGGALPRGAGGESRRSDPPPTQPPWEG